MSAAAVPAGFRWNAGGPRLGAIPVLNPRTNFLLSHLAVTSRFTSVLFLSYHLESFNVLLAVRRCSLNFVRNRCAIWPAFSSHILLSKSRIPSNILSSVARGKDVATEKRNGVFTDSPPLGDKRLSGPHYQPSPDDELHQRLFTFTHDMRRCKQNKQALSTHRSRWS